MLTNLVQELQQARAHLASLEAEVAAQMSQELASLPAKYGFADVDSFAAAVLGAAGKRRGRKPKASSAAAPSGASKGRKPRAKITDAVKAELKKLVQAGATGAEIAKTLKISLPSVYNVKKALGLIGK
jgi:hypothetical protein